jgi:hypothetical protein
MGVHIKLDQKRNGAQIGLIWLRKGYSFRLFCELHIPKKAGKSLYSKFLINRVNCAGRDADCVGELLHVLFCVSVRRHKQTLHQWKPINTAKMVKVK